MGFIGVIRGKIMMIIDSCVVSVKWIREIVRMGCWGLDWDICKKIGVRSFIHKGIDGFCYIIGSLLSVFVTCTIGGFYLGMIFSEIIRMEFPRHVINAMSSMQLFDIDGWFVVFVACFWMNFMHRYNSMILLPGKSRSLLYRSCENKDWIGWLRSKRWRTECWKQSNSNWNEILWFLFIHMVGELCSYNFDRHGVYGSLFVLY